MSEPNYILRGICGSTAHGLAHAGSDEDLHGVFSWPTESFWALTQPPASLVHTDPDESYHELAKYLGLAAKSNPQVLELLWLDEYIEMEDYWGQALIDLRTAFLSTNYVSHAYGGYADSQFRKLNERGDSFSSSTKNRTFKHAKHMFRLIEQGQKLLETGELRVKVENPDWYLFQMPDMELEDIKAEFALRFATFNEVESVLPEHPDYDRINEYLHDYRRVH